MEAGEIPVNKIEFVSDTIKITIQEDGYKYRLPEYFTISPDNSYDKRYECMDYNDSIISISYDGTWITTRKIGETKLTIVANDGYGACDSCIIAVVPPPVEKIELNERIIRRPKIGEQVQLRAAVYPLNSVKSIVWSSDDDAVAQVDSNGLVTIVGYGITFIHATSTESPEIQDSCKIYSDDYTVKIKMDYPTYDGLFIFELGDSFNCNLETEPENLPIYDIAWSSGNDEVLSIDNQGEAICKAVGGTTIACEFKLAGMNLSVWPVGIQVEQPKSIVFENESYTMSVGEQVEIKAFIFPEDAKDKSISWTSSDESVASVDKNGVVQAYNNGTAIITAKYGKAMASCLITVRDILVESLSLTPSDWIGTSGDYFYVTALILPENATNKTLSWELSDGQVAEFDPESGLVRVKDNGYCIITASTTDGSDLHADCIITTEAGIDGVIKDEKCLYDVYSPLGNLLRSGCNAEYVRNLPHGVYIIVHNGIAMKIIVL